MKLLAMVKSGTKISPLEILKLGGWNWIFMLLRLRDLERGDCGKSYTKD